MYIISSYSLSSSIKTKMLLQQIRKQNLPRFKRKRLCFSTKSLVTRAEISCSILIMPWCEHNASGQEISYAPSRISNSTYAFIHYKWDDFKQKKVFHQNLTNINALYLTRNAYVYTKLATTLLNFHHFVRFDIVQT